MPKLEWQGGSLSSSHLSSMMLHSSMMFHGNWKKPRNRILEKAWKMPEGWNASLDALAGLLGRQRGDNGETTGRQRAKWGSQSQYSLFRLCHHSLWLWSIGVDLSMDSSHFGHSACAFCTWLPKYKSNRSDSLRAENTETRDASGKAGWHRRSHF